MANLHLVTGYAGQAHITAEDHGSMNASLFGGGSYVLNRGNKFSASAITSNQIRVLDGDLLLQGRHIRLAENSYVDLTIDSGAQGMHRNDLIVARYTKNNSSGVEECNLVVIKGTAVTSGPSDPTHSAGDILVNHDAQVDFPLYRVSLNGLAVSLTRLFEVVTVVTVGEDGKIKSDYLPSMNYIPTSQKGSAGGVASLDSSGKVPSGQLPAMNYIPTSQKGVASGVAPLNANKKVDVTYLPVGVANGVASLGSNGKVPASQLSDTLTESDGVCTVTPVSDQLWTAEFCTGGWRRYGRFVYAEFVVQIKVTNTLAWDENAVNFTVTGLPDLPNKLCLQATAVRARVGAATKYGQVVEVTNASGDSTKILISVIGMGSATSTKLTSGAVLQLDVNLSYVVTD